MVLPSNIHHATTGDCGNIKVGRNNDYVKYVTMITATLILLPVNNSANKEVWSIRPVLLYGVECWTVGKKEEQILEKTEMRMLSRIKGVTLRDKVKSVDIRKELGLTRESESEK